jgi:G:T-mismatch repair DNA endonuclease (very short patch repair protein)
MEQTDGVVIKHARNGREYRLPELSQCNVVVYSTETNTVFWFVGSYWKGYAGHPFRDVINTNVNTLVVRYEQTMARLQLITRAGYKVKIQWECYFDDAGIDSPELIAHPIVCYIPICTREAFYGGRTEAMRLHFKLREGETIQYVDVKRLYP